VDSVFHTASIASGTSFMPARLRRAGVGDDVVAQELSGL
jgi:hypothetical protein